MRTFQLWAAAHIVVLGSAVGGLGQECPSQATTTVFVPTTIYATAPNPSYTEQYSSVSSKEGDAPGTATGVVTSNAGNTEVPTSSVILPPTGTAGTISPVPTGNGTWNPPPGIGKKPPGPFGGYTNAVYFTNWGIYGSNYQPQQLPVSDLTHILYAFADIAPDGTVKSSDAFADTEKRYATDSENDVGHNAYGVIKQLFLHKKKHRNLKTLLSIGGWTYSPKFVPVAATEAGRRTFAASAVKLMVDYGFDGLDVDWEYPANAEEAANFVLLLRACREELDRYSAQNSLAYRFLITVASPAGPVNYRNMDLAGMDKYVDGWNMMAYDYSGSWDTTAGHQSNLYKNTAKPNATKFNTNDAVRYYQAQGISPQKINVGLPLYGRSFEATAGLGESYNGVGEGGPQPGVWLYKTLPRPGSTEQWDDAAKASYSYDARTRELISYDTVRSVAEKARYLGANGLGGAFFWEASGDRAGAASLIGSMARGLRGLDSRGNNLRYPTSQYDNIRKGMP